MSSMCRIYAEKTVARIVAKRKAIIRGVMGDLLGFVIKVASIIAITNVPMMASRLRPITLVALYHSDTCNKLFNIPLLLPLQELF